MKILISGGCKNGKSYYAQHLAASQTKKGKPLYYIATMIPSDGEDQDRIKRHRAEREGWGFITLEQPRDIHSVLNRVDPEGSFLLDSTTALLANEMFPANGEINTGAYIKIREDLRRLAGSFADMVIVSDGIYSDACVYDQLVEGYRKGLAAIDRDMAVVCDSVLEISFGNVITHKEKGV